MSRVRTFCAAHPEILHLEVGKPDQIHDALAQMAAADPRVLVINGGDGTVQATLTELINGRHFDDAPPPIAVLPNGKTNLIAKDLGARGDPVRALERILALAEGDMAGHIVTRELISLSDGTEGGRPALGMFLGAGALADIILFCRNKIYPLGLPNGASHLLAVLSGFLAVFTDRSARFLPPPPANVRITVGNQPPLTGSFQVLMVTTLHELVLTGKAPAEAPGKLQLLAVERRALTVFRAIFVTLIGRLGRKTIPGIHLRSGPEVRIESERVSIVMDGELFEAKDGHPITLTRTDPVRFLSLAG